MEIFDARVASDIGGPPREVLATLVSSMGLELMSLWMVRPRVNG
jgi:hypothetical protein